MKAEMRRALAQESFEQKIRKVGDLIRLAAVMKTQRIQEEAAKVICPGRKINRRPSVDNQL
jgi:hypothetical protein